MPKADDDCGKGAEERPQALQGAGQAAAEAPVMEVVGGESLACWFFFGGGAAGPHRTCLTPVATSLLLPRASLHLPPLDTNLGMVMLVLFVLGLLHQHMRDPCTC
jgi:hypothetical protein